MMYVQVVKAPVYDYRGEVVGTQGFFWDVTARKFAEERLKETAAELARSNEELERFASVASHDLQEPLRKIQAFGDRLRAKCGDQLTEQGADYLERMLNAADRMRTLINDLLTFSRVTTRGQPFVPVNLSELVGEILSDLEVRIEQTAARVEVDDLPTLDADPTQMRQLFQNLVGNALKFHREGVAPHIRIQVDRRVQVEREESAARGSAACHITVRDNGIGFDEKYTGRIFNVFQRLHGRGEYEGTGIGLAVCEKIVKRHGGSITAKSRPGEGAAFIVTLPVSHATEEETS
jgi:light-regulated signal transduction histidine kinase (bacteriophytochrome)